VTPQQRYKLAVELEDSGDYEKALELVEQGLTIAPKDLKLLELRGAVLVKLRDYAGALAAYKAYLGAGAMGGNRRQAEKIIDNLHWAGSTFLDVTVANGPADIYLDLKAQGVFCKAAPSCHKAVLPGEYKVIAERAGFGSWTGRVTIANGESAKLAVTLVERRSQLTVRVVQPGAHVTVDGQDYDAPILVAAGMHRVVVSLAGYADAQLEVAVHEGRPVEQDVSLVPIRDEAPGGSWFGRLTGRRKIALAAAGVGLAATGAGVGLGLRARHLDDSAYALCRSPTIPCPDAPNADGFNRHARSRALQANIAYGVAGGFAIAAAALWLTGSLESRVAVTPHLGATAGIDLKVRF